MRRFGGAVKRGARFSVERREYNQCIADQSLSRRMAAFTLSHHAEYPDPRWSRLLFPFVCQGEPLYHVYALSGRDLVTVYLWDLHLPGPVLTWEFDRDRPQRQLPDVAATNVIDQSLWFREVVLDKKRR